MSAGAARPAPSAGDLSARLGEVRERIAATGRDPASVSVVAVTKGFPPEVARVAVEVGLADLGENYAQELRAKAPAVAGARWHFLGAPQRNKLTGLVPLVDLWHALDRVEVLERLARLSPGAKVLVQVNLTGDPGRPGCRPEETADLVARGRAGGLEVTGLMTVGPAGDPAGARRVFAALSARADQLGLAERSMGMSDDYEIAVEEGATLLRLGRVLFGPRPGGPGARR